MSKKFDPRAILEEAKQNSGNIQAFAIIDESSFEKAPNFLSWVIDPQFLNTRILPKQIEMGTKIFADWCPLCSTPGYINTLFDQTIGDIKTEVVFLENGNCPKCKKTRYELVQSKDLLIYNEFVGAWGQRSGKSKLTALLATYLLHRFLTIPDPLKKFNLPSGELLTGTFAALTLDQAKTTIWDSFRGFIDGSPWFKAYHAFLKKEGKRIGKDLLKISINSISYNHKHILMHCTGSQDRKMRGKTRFFFFFNENG